MHKFLSVFSACMLGIFLSACSETDAPQNQKSSEQLSAQLYAQLQTAAYKGDIEQVRALLQKGADVNRLVIAKKYNDVFNETDEYYEKTPLMLASQQEHLEVVKELIAAGANVNQTLPVNTEREMLPGENQTALEMACWFNNMEILKTLARAGTDPQSIIRCACLCGDEELLQIALQKKPNVNFVYGMGGISPLILAAERGDDKIVKALLDAGADPNYTDPYMEDDYTALQAAKNDPEITAMLKAAGAVEKATSSN